jgi:hypothetical protein
VKSNGIWPHILWVWKVRGVVPCTLRGVISFNKRAKLCPFYCTLSISFVKSDPWVNRRTTGQKVRSQNHGSRLAFLVSRYTRYLLKIAYESVERHSQVSPSHYRSSASRNLLTSGFLSKQHSHVLRECWILEMGGRSRLGHSDSSSCSGRSNWKISHVGRSCDGAIVHHFYHLQHEWVTCLCSGHWLIVRVWILVQRWLG